MIPLRQTIFHLLKTYAGWLLVLWWAFSFYLTHAPIPEEAPNLPYVDKLVHIVIYTLLAFLFSLWRSKYSTIKLKQIIGIAAILTSYAVLDEYLQGFVGRNPDIKDVVADMLGIVIGITIFLQWQKLGMKKDSWNL